MYMTWNPYIGSKKLEPQKVLGPSAVTHCVYKIKVLLARNQTKTTEPTIQSANHPIAVSW
jgi:hypothetical protein